MAINDVLPLKTARRYAIANFKCFGAPGHEQPNFDLFIYVPYAAPSYSARISAIYLRFRKVWLGYVCRVRRLATKQNAEFTVCEWNLRSYFNRLLTKVREISDDVGHPSYFPTTLPNCRCRVSFRRYSTLSLEVVEKPSKCQMFLTFDPPIFTEGLPRLFYHKLLARFTVRVWQNFGWVAFAGLRLRSLAIKWNTEFMEGG